MAYNKAMVSLFLMSLVLASGLIGHASASLNFAPNRKMLQFGGGPAPYQRQANTVRAQAQTAQAIESAVNSGGSLGQTRRAGVVGTSISWATSQRDNVFNVVERATAPNTFNNGR